MQERRRKFYGWGYEGDTVSPAETAEFESAWSRLLGVDHFEAVPFPKEEDIDLRAPRIQAPASLAAICTTDKYDRLYHLWSGHRRCREVAPRRVSQPAGRNRLSEE